MAAPYNIQDDLISSLVSCSSPQPREAWQRSSGAGLSLPPLRRSGGVQQHEVEKSPCASITFSTSICVALMFVKAVRSEESTDGASHTRFPQSCSSVCLVLLRSCRASGGRVLRLNLHNRQLGPTTNSKSGTRIMCAGAQSWQPRSSNGPFAGPGVERAAAGEGGIADHTAIFASSLHNGVQCTNRHRGLCVAAAERVARHAWYIIFVCTAAVGQELVLHCIVLTSHW
jgi:hypothetical protein